MTEPFVAMTDSYTPLVSAAQLGVYLNDDSLDVDRAEDLLEDAQVLCESIVSPLPPTAAVVVKRVAGRAYVTVTSARQAQLAAAQAGYGAVPGGMGDVHLTRTDERDLRRLAGGTGGAFTIDMLPAGYTAPVAYYNTGFDVIP